MAITAAQVKELRELTGAGMMDCKKALAETDGNMEAAVDVLRKSGAVKAEKKASRIAAEGICRAAVNGTTGVVVEVNSETDFVAKNEIFQTFVQQIADQALASSLVGGKDGEDVEALLGENGLKEALVDKTATIGEKLSFRRFQKLSGDVVVDYLHGNGRIGVIVAGNGASDDAAKEALKNVAMQIAAMNPQYITGRRPYRHRFSGSGHRRGRSAGDRRLRQGAQAVRPQHLRFPEHPVRAGRDEGPYRGCKVSGLRCRSEEAGSYEWRKGPLQRRGCSG